MTFRLVRTLESGFSGAVRGLCVDRRDRLFVAGDSEIRGGGVRCATSKPAHSVAVAADGAVYAGLAGGIEIFSPQGQRLDAWPAGTITSLALWKGEIFAGDATQRAIVRLDAKGKVLATIGNDNRVRGFLIPNGAVDFDIDAEGTLHCANPGKHRVERYSAAGKLLGHIGRFDHHDAEGFPGCCNPTNVAFAHGRTYVTEKAFGRAKVLGPDGKLLAVISDKDFDPNVKNMPLAVDSRRRVYVADTVRRQILVFEEAV